ncbi:hypothetical protein ACPEH7_02095 [Stenotrophomonas sp. NPDC101269]|uniref:hypothetical protein n=1 Tax=Stenotrophomonas TaxID=40323 RepID=UPI001290E48A|nr:hypothetical protein [Stenotrophomonas nematodicola]
MTDKLVERLVLAIEAQQTTIAQQAEQIALLVQSVALLLGEEVGTPVADDADPPRTDMDGKPY